MKVKYSGVMIVLLVLLAGCSSVQVSQDYDTEMGVPELSTYGWQQVANDVADDFRVNNPLLHKRFQKAIDSRLRSMGYAPAPSPDFLVRYSFSVTTRLESEPVNLGFGFGLGTYRRFGGFGINSGTEIRQYDIGILIIDFLDPVTDDLLWRGRGSEIVSKHPTPQESSEMASRLVEAILNQFPPR